MTPSIRRLAAVLALSVAPVTAAFALDNVVVQAPGADDALEALLTRASLTAQLQGNADPDAPPAAGEVLSTARSDYRQLVGALYSEGYYGGTVSIEVDGTEAAELSLVDPPARISQVTITVQPGPRFRFSEATVRPLAPETTLPEGYARGEIARSNLIGEAARTGVRGWRAQGHAKARLTEEDIVADHANRRVASNLGIAPGPRLTFGPLVIEGANRVREERIRAIAGLPVGEVYDPEELDDAAERLRRTGAFRAVTLADAEEVGPGDTLPIDLTIVEEKRRRLGAGVEVSSTEGIGASAYWMHRNLFGGAENLRFELEIENISAPDADNGTDYRLSGAFRRPATPITDMNLLFFGYIERTDDPGYLAETAYLGGGFSYVFSDALEVSGGIAYRYSRVEDAFGERDFQMLVFPATATYDTRDDALDPTGGIYARGEARPFLGVVDIDNGAQLTGDARTYLGFGEDKRLVAAGRLQFGSLFGPDISEAPPDYLFFAGGGGSVRGQPYQSLGTGEFDGRIVGGRSYLALSAEMRAYVRGPIGVVGFVDSGYVGAEEFYDGSGEWMTGAGLGVRYDTGFGPIRVDVGTPVDGGPDDADAVQIYIGIGQAF